MNGKLFLKKRGATMTIYIALLRGINVGGKHKIKMADLKHLLEEMGMNRVQTYIQSGNVLFESEESADVLKERMEQEIEKAFGFPVPVMLRTSSELERIVEQCPFSFEALGEGESIHLNFLTTTPTEEAIAALPDLSGEIDEYRVLGKEIYFYLRQSILDSKVVVKLAKLGAPQTSRNWKTVLKLHEMVKKIEG